MRRIKSLAKALLFALAAFPIRVIGCIYWSVVYFVMRIWSRRALHSLRIGSFVAGSDKQRSFYRDEMLLKTFVLAVRMQNRSCLDLGCNDGYWSFRLAQFGLSTVIGIDASYEEICRANVLKNIYSYPNYKFKHGDLLSNAHFENGISYDIILLLSVLYHLPESADWDRFFKTIAEHNSETLIIDSRWFENDAYWNQKTGDQAVIESGGTQIGKWRPLRKDVIAILHRHGYARVIEVNPSPFLESSEEARGNNDPYSLENVADYITGNRTLLIAYKSASVLPITAESIGALMS